MAVKLQHMELEYFSLFKIPGNKYKKVFPSLYERYKIGCFFLSKTLSRLCIEVEGFYSGGFSATFAAPSVFLPRSNVKDILT